MYREAHKPQVCAMLVRYARAKMLRQWWKWNTYEHFITYLQQHQQQQQKRAINHAFKHIH